MSLVTVDCQTSPSGQVNEDRAGAVNALAWVIDGATDVVETPLTRALSDADWIAGRLDATLRDIGASAPADLAGLPSITANRLAADFAREAIRQPTGKFEHPSASALIVRPCRKGLDYVAVGDCSMLSLSQSGFVRAGVEADAAGDRQLAAVLSALHNKHGGLDAVAARAHVWPSIRAARAAMNEPTGYGVFSLTPTPMRFVRTGQVVMQEGGHVLLATDGLMRLVDVFGCYSARDLLCAAVSNGLEALLRELRGIETSDADGHRYPRAKAYDDATGLLLRWT
jgi:hypothetical protein